jgi:hypothetical protein
MADVKSRCCASTSRTTSSWAATGAQFADGDSFMELPHPRLDRLSRADLAPRGDLRHRRRRTRRWFPRTSIQLDNDRCVSSRASAPPETENTNEDRAMSQPTLSPRGAEDRRGRRGRPHRPLDGRHACRTRCTAAAWCVGHVRRRRQLRMCLRWRCMRSARRSVFGLLLPERDSSAPSVRDRGRMWSREQLGISVHQVQDIARALEGLGCYEKRDEAMPRVSSRPTATAVEDQRS